MNKSEQLLSAFSENYFYKELVFDNLCFTPKGGTEKELADLLINLGEYIIAIQLKSRNETSMTNDGSSEIKWLANKCKTAKRQVKDTLRFISTDTLPPFNNKRGESIRLNPDAKVIPLVVFENDRIHEYPHLLKKHSDEGISVNCMSFSDFQEMCRILCTPIEIISYLDYRKNFYEKYDEMHIITFDGVDDELVITRPEKKESLVFQFLSEQYGYKEVSKNDFLLEPFQDFLHHLPEHTVVSSQDDGSYQILVFLAHLNRAEIKEFMKRLMVTRDEAKVGTEGVCKSLRRQDNEYAIFFVAGAMLPMECLLSVVRKKAEVRKVLEVNVYWEDNENFRIDFLYRNNGR